MSRRLKAIIYAQGYFPSLQQLDYKTCFSRGIRVLCAAPVFGPLIAELGLALALSVARRVTWNDADFRNGNGHWSHNEFRGEFSIYGVLAGLIGFGSVGRNLRQLLNVFECPVQVHDPWMTDAYLRTQDVRPVDINTLMSRSRLIFVLAAQTETNFGVLDRRKLELIQPEAVLILISQARFVDLEALTELLLAKRFCAAINVSPIQQLTLDHPIHRASNVILYPENAAETQGIYVNVGRMIVNDLEAISLGLPTRELEQADPAFVNSTKDQATSAR